MDISTLKNKKVFILDLDGTVYLGDTPIESAISFINLEDRIFFYVTNNTSKSIEDYKKKLQSIGINSVSQTQIITPIRPLLTYLKENNLSKVYVVATDSFKNDLMKHSIDILSSPSQECEALILAYDTSLDYNKIIAASELINRGIPYLATHIDINCPSPKGGLPDVGSFVSMFKTSTGREPDIYFGKPSEKMIESILEKHKKDDVVFVGDRIYTDRRLAENCSIDFCLVLSGETSLDNIKDLPKDFYILEKLTEELN